MSALPQPPGASPAPYVPPAPHAPPALEGLVVERIRVAYASHAAQPVLDGFSLGVPAGTIGCLLGPSGCGKTTVLRAVAGFEPVLSGGIALNGRLLSSATQHLPPEQRQVGMVFQEHALFPHLTAAQNIAFGLRWRDRNARDTRVAALLELVGLAAQGRRYPHELSGGQQQRIALARALAPSPALLLLDEPFASLDTATRTRLAAEVRDILRGAGQTALLVTHHEDEARRLADRVFTLQAGRIG